ncbi:MAG: zinc-binding alcohol dehydrogenase family protein [Nocardioidaceae bacterium]
MRAALVHTPGEPPVLGDSPVPVAGPGRTLVRVSAAPVVPLDLLCASGTSYFGRPGVPYVPGVQGVGVATESGAVAAGSRVWFATSAGMAPGDGSLAEWCVADDDDLVPVDADVSDPLVAALGLSAVAAWMALSWRAALRPGERVLVLGGGGAVGQAGIGSARALGAGSVVAVARSEQARRRALDAGADDVVAGTGSVEELAARLARASGGEVDVVLDPVFGSVATAASRVLAPGGRLVNLGGAAGDEAVLSSAVLRSRSASVLGYTNSSLTPVQRRDALTAVLRHAAAGTVSLAHVSRPLASVREVWLALAGGSSAPRVVLVP